MNERILLCEWDADALRKKLAYWEALGYRAILNTFKITSDRDPITGRVYESYCMDVEKPQAPWPSEMSPGRHRHTSIG